MPIDPAQRRPAQWNSAPLPHVRKLIAIASGKGGVGKSTVAVMLAHTLTEQGLRVGLLDADIHGPSIPRMLGVADAGQPEIKDDLMIPIVGHHILNLSMGHLVPTGEATVWRGPMVTKALKQMLRHARWGTEEHPLDVLLIDMPPGTGDIHLTLAQSAPLDGALVVTTPQDIAVMDADKCAQMFAKINVPLLGIIENMSYFTDPAGTQHYLFGQGGGAALAQKTGTDLLAQLPIDQALGAALDQGKKPIPDKEYHLIATELSASLLTV